MNTIKEIFDSAKKNGTQPISLEIFPPKGKLSVKASQDITEKLAQLNPSFISVTYSAGGSGNSAATSEIASMIQAQFNIASVAHLTCAGATPASIKKAIEHMKASGIKNVLALRGDLAPGMKATHFQYAKQLIPELVNADFCVGAAAYPEGHITCTNSKLSIEHLKQKQDSGASFFVTQLFFDNSYFYKFFEDAQKAGIKVPICAGVMPFMSKAQISRMVFMCGVSLPSQIVKLLARYENDEVALKQAGIEYACKQLADLKAHGVEGLHIYTMNKPEIAAAAFSSLCC